MMNFDSTEFSNKLFFCYVVSNMSNLLLVFRDKTKDTIRMNMQSLPTATVVKVKRQRYPSNHHRRHVYIRVLF